MLYAQFGDEALALRSIRLEYPILEEVEQSRETGVYADGAQH